MAGPIRRGRRRSKRFAPYRKGKKRSTTARRGTRMIRRVPRLVPGSFPPLKRVKLKYVTQVSLNPSTSLNDYAVFRANSLYDPEYATGGHQPMWHDVYASVYDNYRVYFSKITVVPLNNHVVNVYATNQTSGTTTSDTQYYASNQRAVKLFIIRDRDYNDVGSINSFIEEGNTNFKWRYVTQNMSPRLQRLSFVQSPPKLCNLPAKDDSMNLPFGSNPEDITGKIPTYFIVGAASYDSGVSNPDAMSFEVTITYYCILNNLKKGQSAN